MPRATDSVYTARTCQDVLTLFSRDIGQQFRCTAASGMATNVDGDVAFRPPIPTTGRQRFDGTEIATRQPRKTWLQGVGGSLLCGNAASMPGLSISLQRSVPSVPVQVCT